jgi:hypothetical protein
VFVKLSVWSLFGVTGSLLPFYIKYFLAFDRKDSVPWTKILGDGELIIVSVVINAAAIGELISKETPPHFRLPKIYVIGFSVLMLCVMSAWFADISGPRPPEVDASGTRTWCGKES